MDIVKIRSNPYKKKVAFYSLDRDGNWNEIRNDNGDSKLREEGSEKVFLPFKIKEIIDIIRKEYYVPGGNKVTVVFEGTADEFYEVQSICNDEEVMDEIELKYSDEYLDDARDILKNIKEIFFNVQPILDNIIGDDIIVKKSLAKVTDALDDIIPICVFGNYSAGKSTFINALIGKEILPSGGDPVTAKIYKISSSTQEDRIEIAFSYREEEIQLRFDENGYKVIKGSKESDLICEVDQAIEKMEHKDLVAMVSATLDIINGFERRDQDEVVISDVVSIEVAFSNNGVLGQSKNKFVIFDTPGSNSNSNRNHADILRKAMEGFSNGIPVWVSQYDSIDSIDNANLCNDIYSIDALDKRFTMIVINKADTAELPENGWTEQEIKNFMEYDAIEKMYSGGIFFVSSIMGLGAKNDAKFHSRFLKKTFKEQKESFSDPEDEEFYQTLYKYDIMPMQIKENAIAYSLMHPNLIYANSGLLCVEKEMETFASKHSSYNKCQMVYAFLNSIIDKANQRIEDSKDMLSGYRLQEQEKLNEKQLELKVRMEREANDLVRKFDKESEVSVNKFVKENVVFRHTVDELNTLDRQYTEANEQERNFTAYQKEYEEATEKTWSNLKKNIKGFVKREVKFSEVTNTYLSDLEELKANKESLYFTKKEVDKATSDTLIDLVTKEYKNHLIEAQETIDQEMEEHWQENAEKFKKQLVTLITESEALTLQERNEISTLIFNFEPLLFTEGPEDVFEKKKFQKLGREKLNNRRLAEKYNKKIDKKIMDFAKYRNEKCKDSFHLWSQRLRAVIDQNITEYNPELRTIARNIAMLSDNISKLESNQKIIKASFDSIGEMMSWKNDNADEGED